ncbi:MAG: DUF6171 family protein [Lachnospiraceae bacterium]|nr:DUF6171 family protein [Lachnospiraceae bacterium]
MAECKRCLLRDLSEKDYENIKKYIDMIPERERADKDIYEKRLSVCRECDLLASGTCNACGCYVEIRALGKDASCPKKKW